MKRFVDRLSSMLESGRLSDITIICGAETLTAHKVILCAHSPVLEKEFMSEVDEDSHSSNIDLSSHHPAAVAALLRYFYSFDYETDIATTLGISTTMLHMEVCKVAKKYAVDPLYAIAKAYFEAALCDNWNTESLADVVKQVFADEQCEDEVLSLELQGLVLGVIRSHVKLFYSGAKEFEAFRKIADRIPEISSTVLQAMVTDSCL